MSSAVPPCMRIPSALFVCAVAFSPAATSAALADEPLPVVASEAERAERTIQVGARVSGLSNAALTLGMSNVVRDWILWDNTLSIESLGEGKSGAGMESLLRLSTTHGPLLASVGLGPSFKLAKGFGAMGSAVVEAAVEYRLMGGVNLLLGLGAETPLWTSNQASCQLSTGLQDCSTWRDQYKTGEVFPRIRLAIGRGR
jgi:hypothetical protein